jgi:hypothetical protein
MGVVLNIHIVRRRSNNEVYAIRANSCGSQNIIIDNGDFIVRKNILFGLVVSTGNIPLITNYTPKLLLDELKKREAFSLHKCLA